MDDNKPDAILKLEKFYGKKIKHVKASDLWASKASYCMDGDGTVTRLKLSYCGISDLSPLAKLTGLTRLDLDFNGITDLSPLAQLNGLAILRLDGNKISGLSPLIPLLSSGQLKSLDLTDNKITRKRGRCDKTTMLQELPGINTQESLHFRWVLKFLYIARKPDKPKSLKISNSAIFAFSSE